MKLLIFGVLAVVIAVWVVVKSPGIFDDVEDHHDQGPDEDGRWGDDD